MSRKVAGPPEFYLRSIFLNDGRSSLQVMFFFSSGFKCLGVPPPVVGKIGGNATKRVLSIYAAPPLHVSARVRIPVWPLGFGPFSDVFEYLAPHSDLKAALSRVCASMACRIRHINIDTSIQSIHVD